MKNYKFKYDSYPGITAEEAAEELCKIEKSSGKLTAEAVIKAASAKKHKLHPFFEWDDSRAANKHRLQQARTFIGNVVVEYDEVPDVPVRVRVHTGDGVYEETRKALESKSVRDYVLETALRELKTFTVKYQHLIELSRVVGESKKVLDRLYKQHADKGD